MKKKPNWKTLFIYFFLIRGDNWIWLVCERGRRYTVCVCALYTQKKKRKLFRTTKTTRSRIGFRSTKTIQIAYRNIDRYARAHVDLDNN